MTARDEQLADLVRRTHMPGWRVRIVDEPEPVGMIRRGVVASVHRIPDTDPAEYLHDVRLDAGAETVTGLPADRLVREDSYAMVRRLAARWTGNAWPGSAARVVELVAGEVHRKLHAARYPETVSYPDEGDPRPEVTGDDLLDALGAMREYRDGVDGTERYLIAAARARGMTWDAIGLVLGYKPSAAKQSARARFNKLGGWPASWPADLPVLSVDPDETEQ